MKVTELNKTCFDENCSYFKNVQSDVLYAFLRTVINQEVEKMILKGVCRSDILLCLTLSWVHASDYLGLTLQSTFNRSLKTTTQKNTCQVNTMSPREVARTSISNSHIVYSFAVPMGLVFSGKQASIHKCFQLENAHFCLRM